MTSKQWHPHEVPKSLLEFSMARLKDFFLPIAHCASNIAAQTESGWIPRNMQHVRLWFFFGRTRWTIIVKIRDESHSFGDSSIFDFPMIYPPYIILHQFSQSIPQKIHHFDRGIQQDLLGHRKGLEENRRSHLSCKEHGQHARKPIFVTFWSDKYGCLRRRVYNISI